MGGVEIMVDWGRVETMVEWKQWFNGVEWKQGLNRIETIVEWSKVGQDNAIIEWRQ